LVLEVVPAVVLVVEEPELQILAVVAVVLSQAV